MADKWDQYAAPAAPAADKWDQFAEAPAKPLSWLDQAGQLVKGAWDNLAQTGQGMVNTVAHPYYSVKGMLEGQDALRLKAEESFKKGDYVGGLQHVINYAIPMAGPGIDQLGEEAKSGQPGAIAHSIGGSLMMGAQLAGPGLLARNAIPVGNAMEATGAAAKGAIVQGAKAAISPKTMIGAAPAEFLAERLGLPTGTGAVVVAGPRIVSAAIRGARASLAERAAAPVTPAAVTPPDTPAPFHSWVPSEVSEGVGGVNAPLRAPLASSSGATIEYPQPTATSQIPVGPVEPSTFPAGGSPVRPPITSSAGVPIAAPEATTAIPARPFVGPTTPRGVGAPLRPPIGSADLTELLQQSIDQAKAGPPSPVTPLESVGFEGAAQIKKAGTLAQALFDGGIPLEDAKLMEPAHWEMLAKSLGVNKPSLKSVSQTLFELNKLESKTAPAAPTPPTAAATPGPAAPQLVQDARATFEQQKAAGTDSPSMSYQTPAPPDTVTPGVTPDAARIAGINRQGSEVYGPGGAIGQETPAGNRAPSAPPANPAAQTTVRVPGNPRQYPARYKVVELGDIQPSHNGQTFEANPKYALKNDRDYTRPENQRKILDWSGPDFDPHYLITDNPDATNGPPVLDSSGNVMGGNGRSMLLDRVHAMNPAGAQAYRDLLTQKAAQFGQDPAQVAGMKQPVLVREISTGDLPDKQQAVTDFNVGGTAALRPAEKAIADSRRVSTDTLDHIAGRLEAHGQDATLSQVLDGRGGADVLQKLISDGVISPQESAAYMDKGVLTAEGKTRISKLMLGRFFRDPAQLDLTPPSLVNKLERIAAPLAKIEGHAEWSLTDPMQRAMDLLDEARAHGQSNLDDLAGQGGLFGEQKHGPDAIALAKMLQKATPNALTKAVRQYAQDASEASRGGGLFGEPPTQAQAFNDAFGVPTLGKLGGKK